jgi:hypothetical protein
LANIKEYITIRPGFLRLIPYSILFFSVMLERNASLPAGRKLSDSISLLQNNEDSIGRRCAPPSRMTGFLPLFNFIFIHNKAIILTVSTLPG